MIDLLESLKDATIGLFNSYHNLTVGGLDAEDDEYASAGFLPLTLDTTIDDQYSVENSLKNAKTQSLSIHDQGYVWIAKVTFDDINSFFRLHKFISEWDGDQPPVNTHWQGDDLYRGIYKLYEDEMINEPIRQNLKKLLQAPSSIDSATKSRSISMQTIQQIREYVLEEITHLSEFICTDLWTSETSESRLQELPLSFPDLRKYISEADFVAVRKGWERIRDEAIDSLTVDPKRRAAAILQRQQLSKNPYAFEAWQSVFNRSLHSGAQAVHAQAPQGNGNIVRKYGQRATEIRRHWEQVESHGLWEHTSTRRRDMKDGRMEDFGNQSNPRTFLGRRGST